MSLIWSEPLRGMGIGERLAWLAAQRRALPLPLLGEAA